MKDLPGEHQTMTTLDPIHQEFEKENYYESDSAIAEQRDTSPAYDDIAQLAYHLWLQRGCPDGCPDEDWYRAEQELAGRHSSGNE
jgi:hypothetical protein